MRLVFSIIMILIASWGSPVCAGVVPQTESQPLLAGDINTVTYLDDKNVLDLPDKAHWDITESGTYILTYSPDDINPDVISTSNPYAVLISASDVIFDGNGKTITGLSIGTVESGPSYYGVRVGSGTPMQNVTVKNLTVTNKGFGVFYKNVQGGGIQGSHFSSNGTGIYALESLNLNIQSNTVYSNSIGITLGSANDYFTIDSNNVYSNALFGIYLWWSNNHNNISNNRVNDNNMGIVLTDGEKLPLGSGSGTDNTISGNTINGNVNGIFLSNYHNNIITGNSLYGNTNVSVWLLASSSGNQFTGNYVQESGGWGMYLEGKANGNKFYNNVFKNGQVLVNPDKNYASDGTVFNNQWNITPVAGENIVGGPSIGGNYWSNRSSTGFSNNHPDGNFDGFCDQPYNPQSDLIDNYPLRSFTNDINTLTNLDESNAQGLTGSRYWDITAPGTYKLNIPEDEFLTNHNYAVRILASDVIFDGNGKTITGSGIGTMVDGPSYYGVRVNSGTLTQNVIVKNVTVSNKNFGVIFEYVQGGEISSTQFALNNYGIYTWNCSNLKILSNTINSNNYDGIVLDAHQSTNDYFTIDSNEVYANGNSGIMLWFSNNHNTITNNQVHDNNRGITLTDGNTGASGTNNTISGNTVNGNVNGIFVSNYNENLMNGNSLSGNSNAAVLIEFSSNRNTITNNQMNGNNRGIMLTDWESGVGGTNNTISGNTVNGNVTGIFVSNYNENLMNGNSLSGNSNAGIWIQFSSNRNIITNNQVNDNMNMGIVLTDERSGVGGTDNTISGNTVNRNVNGIFLRNYHGNRITGNSLSDNSNVGVWLLAFSSGNRFTGNYVLSSETTGWWGMYLSESANGNIFYNNVFKNSHGLINPDENYGADETVTVDSNQWYITPGTEAGVNIVGGPTIGGNYWGNASSTGFSDTHPDSNNDGFCDQPYHPYQSTNPHSELIDQYPLHKVAVFNVSPGNLSFGYVSVGSTKDLILTVKNTGAGTLTGNAATAAPFSVVSGGSYSLGPDQSQVVTIRYQPTSAGPHTGEVLFTGGGGATVPVTGSKPEAPRGLPWLILLLGN